MRKSGSRVRSCDNHTLMRPNRSLFLQRTLKLLTLWPNSWSIHLDSLPYTDRLLPR